MNKSESIGKIAGALLKAQRAMGGATKGAANPFFKSRYADYGAVLEACKDPLNDNGIVILQPHDLVEVNGKSYVETVLLHESGEFIASRTEVVCAKSNDPQALGSAITYARRFGLESLVALPREDDDGNAASGKTVATQVTKPTAVKLVETPKPSKDDVAKSVANAEKAANVTKSEPTAKEAAFAAQKAQAPKAKPPVAKTLSEGW